MEFNHHRISTTYEVRQPPLLNHKPTASPPPSPVHIHIDFLHQTTHRFYNRPYHDQDHDNLRRRPQHIATRRPPPTKTSICIPAHSFKFYTTASHRIVSRVLANLRIQPSFQDRVADEVVTRARRFIDSVPNMGRRVIPVRVDVRTVRVHARDEIEWVVRGVDGVGVGGGEEGGRGDGGGECGGGEGVEEEEGGRGWRGEL
ncbi:hypothetical protein RHMOL_Rhmol12G0064000 [Rhododendron molle]|uniref:Uncharacterized protein n=1 Tax=Rhododendron molle TaxID=49168 RepID=A0ACC0LFD1_RHOML|nr:hypothetical protein RHMOL_Rhmol12G0064000 [Rhododendron molle]